MMPSNHLIETSTDTGEIIISAKYGGTNVCFSDWTGGRFISTIGTNAGATVLPFQSWYRFKEAFAPELVERALNETVGSVRHIVDPFGGSGTTALAAQFLGAKPTTIEVNPFLADLIEAKIAPINCDIVAELLEQVIERANKGNASKTPTFRGAPATFIEPGYKGHYIFSKAVARRFLAYRHAIEKVEDISCRRLFRVILASVAIPVSNVVVSGKGRRYRKEWKTRNIQPNIVDELFKTGILCALSDLRFFAARKNTDYRVLKGDARKLTEKVGVHDLAVFSPPYPNSFDYTDIYNVELWALGYLDNPRTVAQLRHSTLRSHVQVLRKYDINDIASATLTATMKALCEVRSQLWNKHIPEMVGAYVTDLAIVLEKLANSMRSFGRVYMIVGDSRYAGIDVPVAKILTESTPSLGYKIITFECCRSIRSSPQQGSRLELKETLIVLERR